MDQRRDGGRTRHRVRQPDVERNLCRFAGDADQHEKRDGDNNPRCGILGGFEDFVELEAAQRPEHDEPGDQETEVADTVGDEGLLRRVRVRPGGTSQRIQLIPEADQQERAQTNTLPANEQHQVGVAADQDHHRGDEQVQENEETRKPSGVILEAHILMHVPNGVDVDQRPDAGDHQHHRRGKRIDPERPVERQCTDMYPLRQPPADHLAVIGGYRGSQQHRDDECRARSQAGDQADHPLAEAMAKKKIDQQAEERGKDQPRGKVGKACMYCFLNELHINPSYCSSGPHRCCAWT